MVEENWLTFADKVKRYFKFSPEETRAFIISAIFLGFIFSFRKWGLGSSVDVGEGLKNFLLMTLIGAITIFVHIGIQRLHALRLGYKPEFRLWSYGIFGSLIVCLLSNGHIAIPLYGGTEIHMMLKHRLGHFRYGVNMVNIGLVAFMGPLGLLFFAYFMKLINIALVSQLIKQLILVNLLVAVWNMLPIPPVIDGARIFFWSRMSYVFMLFTIASAAALIWFSNNMFFIAIASMFIGGLAWFIYYVAYEEFGFEQ